MKQATPAVRDLARRLLAQEAEKGDPSQARVHAALRACEKLRLPLSKLVGVAGFQALLARALVLARAEIPWLEVVRVREDGSLEGFGETAQQQTPDEAAKGGAAVLAQLLGLLVTFIGADLTLRLMGEVWPQAPLSDLNFGAEEAS